MKDVILVAVCLGVFVSIYFWMGHLDKFLNDHCKTMDAETEWKEPACMMLTADVTEEEMLREIRAFRKMHHSIRIVMYDGSETDATLPKESTIGRKS